MDKILLEYLNNTSEKVNSFVYENTSRFLKPDELAAGALLYFKRGGKRLRPALVMMAAGLFGGSEAENRALPCAAGMELFHNWTLIHDDIIDNDDTRRGGKSVHREVASLMRERCPEAADEVLDEYGRDIAILAGDALHAMSMRMLTRLPDFGVSSDVALKIISLADGEYVERLLDGEAVDTRRGLLQEGVQGFDYSETEEEIISVMLGKTSALFSLCAVSGAMIGLGRADTDELGITALRSFCENCGVAFQIKDDILGVTSDEEVLGKPIGSDILEGKATLILTESLRRASDEERRFITSVVGNRDASPEDVKKVASLFGKLGGIDYAEKRAGEYIEKAMASLYTLPENRYRDLLAIWADSMASRRK